MEIADIQRAFEHLVTEQQDAGTVSVIFNEMVPREPDTFLEVSIEPQSSVLLSRSDKEVVVTVSVQVRIVVQKDFSQRAFRVFTDEPQGIVVGFHPAEVCECDFEEVELLADEGGDEVFLSEDGKSVTIGGGEGTPEPDQLVWRTPEEFAEWANENLV